MGDEQDTIEEDKIDINNVDLNESVKSLEKGRLKEYTIKLKKLLKLNNIYSFIPIISFFLDSHLKKKKI